MAGAASQPWRDEVEVMEAIRGPKRPIPFSSSSASRCRKWSRNMRKIGAHGQRHPYEIDG
jgi:hypothetical protein